MMLQGGNTLQKKMDCAIDKEEKDHGGIACYRSASRASHRVNKNVMKKQVAGEVYRYAIFFIRIN
jgi:hypothetical protein